MLTSCVNILSVQAAGLEIVATVLETEVRSILYCSNDQSTFYTDATTQYIQLFLLLLSLAKSVLITNPNSKHKNIVDLLKHRIEGYITSKKFVMISYNCSKDILEAVCKITPGKRSPTITELTDGGHAVSSLVKKSDVVKVMDDLYKEGARDILVFELSNSRM